MKTIRVGFLGCGNVGSGVYRLLADRAEEIRKTENLSFSIEKILVRDITKSRNAIVPASVLTTDSSEVVEADNIDIVLEFMGGRQPAADLMIRALKAGKSVVTANKMALAESWESIMAAASESRSGFLFEASVGGAIPVIRAITGSLQANRISSVMGIINGTTNYILTKMTREGLPYTQVLEEAQKLGLAEPDPTADVEGYDAVYKLSILASLAFHRHIAPENVYREGITSITPLDIQCGKEFGLTLKLLGVAKEENGKIQARVHPTFVPSDHPLASVSGAFNAVFIEGHACGEMMLYGRGAGDMPTASALVSDLIQAAKGNARLPSVSSEQLEVADDWKCVHFIRLRAKDQPGVLAMVAGALAEHGVSIASMVQKNDVDADEKVQLVLLTHRASEKAVRHALSELSSEMISEATVIRVEKA